ncbi:hypothetical protein [Salinicola tamaricis]|uniref:hypothetical protein n=1 Tax=Salinicola tamaricis TaxID=1771309 RepID=UPI0013ED60DC|nr:hypothetical protein [Salinicola tamaricis]
MAWLQLKAHIAPEQAEWLEELLLAEGASAITLQDAPTTRSSSPTAAPRRCGRRRS